SAGSVGAPQAGRQLALLRLRRVDLLPVPDDHACADRRRRPGGARGAIARLANAATRLWDDPGAHRWAVRGGWALRRLPLADAARGEDLEQSGYVRPGPRRARVDAAARPARHDAADHATP